jgi:hypothetical protein
MCDFNNLATGTNNADTQDILSILGNSMSSFSTAL